MLTPTEVTGVTRKTSVVVAELQVYEVVVGPTKATPVEVSLTPLKPDEL
jgi:hypothetical protein